VSVIDDDVSVPCCFFNERSKMDPTSDPTLFAIAFYVVVVDDDGVFLAVVVVAVVLLLVVVGQQQLDGIS
jgi:hypothetical protein